MSRAEMLVSDCLEVENVETKKLEGLGDDEMEGMGENRG